jgi:hypothetical protein
MANDLTVRITADTSGLKAALADAQAQVRAASSNMAEAQTAFGAAAAQGSEQAQAALAEYTVSLQTAEAQLNSLQNQAARTNVSITRPQGSPELAGAASWREAASATDPSRKSPQQSGASAAEAESLGALTAAEAEATAATAALTASTEAGSTAMMAETASTETSAAANQSLAESEITAATAGEAEASALSSESASMDRAAASTGAASASRAQYAAVAGDVVATSETVAAAEAQEAVSAERVAAAQAAYNVAARGTTEQQIILGEAFDRARASGMGFVESEEAAVAALNQYTAAAEGAAAASEADAVAKNESAAASRNLMAGSQIASAEIRTLTGSIGGMSRAAGGLLTNVLGLGPVLEAAFPVIGAIALISILYEVGDKLYEVYEKATQASQAIGNEFDVLADKQQNTLLNVELTNSKLQDQIDKIEGHPGNGLETALLQAEAAAEKLQTALDEDNKSLEALLKKHEVGFLGGLISGVAPTTVLDKDIVKSSDEATEKAREATANYMTAMQGAGGDKDKIAKAQKDRLDALNKVYDDEISTLKPKLQNLYDLQKENNDRLANPIQIYSGPGAAPATSRDIDYSPGIKTLERQIKKLETDKQITAAEAQTEPLQAKLGAEKQNKSIGNPEEQHLRDLQIAFDRQEILYGKSANQTAAYWDQYVGDFKEGSSQLQTVLGKIESAQAQMGRKQPEGIFEKEAKKQVAEAKRDEAKEEKGPDLLAKGYEALQKSQAKSDTEDAATTHTTNVDQIEETHAQTQAKEQTSFVQNPTEQLNELRTFHQQVIAEDQRFIQQEIQIAAGTKELDKVKQLQKQLEIVRHQGNMEWIKDTASASEKVEQQLRQAVQKMQTDFDQFFTKAITGQETWAKAAMSLYKQVADTFIMNVLKMVEQYAIAMLTQNAMQLTQGEKAAKLAAQNTYAQVSAIPVVGPILAPPAAAAAFAAVMAFQAFEQGGVVDGSHGMPVPIIAHAGERVLSASQTSNFHSLVNNSSSGSKTVNNHLHYEPTVHAADRSGMRSTLHSHADDLKDIMGNFLRPEAFA